LSTLAIDGTGRAEEGRGSLVLRYADLGFLALALPIFIVAGWPMLGYTVAAGAWLVQRGVQYVIDRHMVSALRAGNRRGALGALAATTLGRVWFLALAILLVGKLGAREDGLAAALLCAALVTIYLGGTAIAGLLAQDDEAGHT
jgi:hypothetical protein